MRGCFAQGISLKDFIVDGAILENPMPEAVSNTLTNNKAPNTGFNMFFEWTGHWNPEFFVQQGINTDNELVTYVDVYNANSDEVGSHLIMEKAPFFAYRMRGNGHTAFVVINGTYWVSDQSAYTNANTSIDLLRTPPYLQELPQGTWFLFRNLRCERAIYNGKPFDQNVLDRDIMMLNMCMIFKKYTLGL
jgi:hypothetical protein